jgi:starch phosphorylase
VLKFLQKLALDPQIAYFSMEIGFRNDIPTYSGGLGVLAGDTIKSAADLNLPMVAVTLIHRKGYFRQELTPDGRQIEHAEEWDPKALMTLLPNKVHIKIEGRDVSIGAWVYNISNPVSDWNIPIFLLDTDLPENSPEDRAITHYLYGGDDRYRLKQEAILGIGGVLMLRSLGIGVK